MAIRGFTLPQLLLAVAGLMVLAIVVPAVGATVVNRGRVNRAVDDATLISRSLSARAALSGSLPDVLATVGQLPKASARNPWLDGRVEALASWLGGKPTLPSADPWGNCYLVNIGPGAADGGGKLAIWVLSAGPNGVVETPFRQQADAARTMGDDVGVRVR